MASATLLPTSALQSRQISGSMSSSSGTFLGEQAAIRQLSSGVVRWQSRSSTSQWGNGVAAQQSQQQAKFGSKAETLPSPLWVQGSMLTAVDAVSAAQAVRAVNSPTLPASTWIQTPEPVSQGPRCSWPKERSASQGPPASVLFFEEGVEDVAEGQQLHEQFAGELMKRSRSEQLLLDLEAECAPRSAWPRTSTSTDSVEQIVGPHCAWPRAPLKVEPVERILGPRCEWPRTTVTRPAAAPLVVAGPSSAWPKQSQPALSAVIPEAEPLYPRCEWPRREAAMAAAPSLEGPRCAWPATKRAAREGVAKAARASKVKKEAQGWPWRVVPVGLEPIHDRDLAQGPRCAWPRVQPQIPAEHPHRSLASSVTVPAGPRCEWPAKQGVPSLSPSATPSPVLGPRCALKLDAPAAAPAPVLGAACAWPRNAGMPAVSEDAPPALGPRCPIKLPEERPMGPRCALKTPPEPVLGPRCALKLPAVEEARVEGPRCVWPRPGSEPVVASPAEEKENVMPEKVQKKRVGLLPRRALFTRIPVRSGKGLTLARVGKVKVAKPQPEVGQEAAKPMEKAVAAATWPRRLLATSLGLGALNQALLKSQAQAAALDAPAVSLRRLESYKRTAEAKSAEVDNMS